MLNIELPQRNVLCARISLLPTDELTVQPLEYLNYYYIRELLYFRSIDRISYMGPFTQTYQLGKVKESVFTLQSLLYFSSLNLSSTLDAITKTCFKVFSFI